MRILLIEILIPILMLLIGITQVALPIIREQKLFPILRKKDSTQRLLERARADRLRAEKELEAAAELETARKLEARSQQILFKD